MTARIALDRRTFARLAGGRWTGDHARKAGDVRVEGDTELADRVVDNLAFTI
ncbi:MAG: SCP2 sterol-binding domain-containing protein [Acidimicrobiia bacterium]